VTSYKDGGYDSTCGFALLSSPQVPLTDRFVTYLHSSGRSGLSTGEERREFGWGGGNVAAPGRCEGELISGTSFRGHIIASEVHTKGGKVL
jgi:hypothetical protein